MGILPRLFGRRARTSKHKEVDRQFKEQLASLRKAVDQHERDMQATLDHMEHILKPDNFISAKLEDGILKIKYRY